MFSTHGTASMIRFRDAGLGCVWGRSPLLPCGKSERGTVAGGSLRFGAYWRFFASEVCSFTHGAEHIADLISCAYFCSLPEYVPCWRMTP